MDLNNLLNTPPSHKRTSSKADNVNIGQPVLKQFRGQGSNTREGSSSSSSSSSSDASSVEPRLEGVYIVVEERGDAHDDEIPETIVGVFAAKEDAMALIEKERLEFLEERECPPEWIEEDDAGWFFRNEDVVCFSVKYHKVIWPTPKTEVSSPSSESSKSSGDIPASRPGEKSDVDMTGDK